MNNNEDENKTTDFSLPSTHERVTAEKIRSLLSEKKVGELREYVAEHEAVDIAQVIEELTDKDILFLFKVVSSEYTALIFSYLDADVQQKIATSLTSAEVLSLIDELATDDLVDFVEELPSNMVKKVLQASDHRDGPKREEINLFLKFDKDTAGSLMTTEFVEIKEHVSVSQAMEKIRRVGPEAETISTTFVVDSSRKLVGTLELDSLIFAEPEAKIDAILDDDFVSVDTSTDQEKVADLFQKYDLSVMPVVNSSKRLVGIITIDDIVDVIEAETTEDMQKMAGTTPIETPYLKTSVLRIAKSRIFWLLILMISATLTGIIINKFEMIFLAVPVLSTFIPMLMDTSGNAGNQTTTTVTRAIAVGEVHLKDYPRVLLKEFLVSLITGFIVAAFNFVWIFIELKTGIIGFDRNNPEWLIALQVSVTLYLIIILAKCLGSSLPMLAKLIHVDPALMAGPLITTILDTASLAIYFLIARAILPI